MMHPGEEADSEGALVPVWRFVEERFGLQYGARWEFVAQGCPPLGNFFWLHCLAGTPPPEGLVKFSRVARHHLPIIGRGRYSSLPKLSPR